jgi:hypothetical protein
MDLPARDCLALWVSKKPLDRLCAYFVSFVRFVVNIIIIVVDIFRTALRIFTTMITKRTKNSRKRSNEADSGGASERWLPGPPALAQACARTSPRAVANTADHPIGLGKRADHFSFSSTSEGQTMICTGSMMILEVATAFPPCMVFMALTDIS